MSKLDVTPTATPNAAAQPVKRRTRGPNKPKPVPADISVTTEATMGQAAIVKVLTDYASQMLGADTAAKMELQISNISTGAEEKPWRPMTGPDAGTAIIRFATKGSR